MSNLGFQGIDREFFAHLIARCVTCVPNKLDCVKNPYCLWKDEKR
jgi:hypothetical protein